MDDIKAARGVPDVNNAWKAMARHPAVMRRFWERAKAVMQPGALDAPTKELIYLAVSIANGCHYCSASHTALAKKKGATEEQLAEMVEIVGLALEGNSYASFYGQDIDEALKG
nr:carboxymuconolactone decarboxylase family protein [Limobrevibacterium gyesilva]